MIHKDCPPLQPTDGAQQASLPASVRSTRGSAKQPKADTVGPRRVRRRHFGRDERGGALVEAAFVFPVFFLLALGLLDFGRAVWAQHTVSHLAREATRWAIVRGDNSGAQEADEADIEAFVKSKMSGLHPDDITVSTDWDPDNECTTDNDPGCVVEVQVSFDYQPAAPLVPGPLTLQSTSRMVISF